MKKLAAITVAVLLALSVVACDDWSETRRSRLRGDIDALEDRIELLEDRVVRCEDLLLQEGE